MPLIHRGESYGVFKILTQADGTFLDIRFDNSAASDIVFREIEKQSGSIICITGPNRYDELLALTTESPSVVNFVTSIIPNTQPISGAIIIARPEEVEKTLSSIRQKFIPSLYKYSKYLIDITKSLELNKFKPDVYIRELRQSIGAQDKNSAQKYALIQEYIDYIDAIISRSVLVQSVGSYGPIDQYLPLAIWLSKPRRYPLVLLSPAPLSNLEGVEILNIDSQSLKINEVINQITSRLNLNDDEVKTAYKIWSLSRKSTRQGGTLRNTITVAAARDLCSVVSETYTEKIRQQKKPKQHAAPIKFRLADDGLTVLKESHPSDSDTVVRAAASALLNRAEGLSQRGALSNHLPTFPDSINRIMAILLHMCSNNYDDGHIVSLGLEMNALQWEVQAIKDDIGTGALAEITGLFANAHLFLDRFSIWKSYTERDQIDYQEAYASFSISKGLLQAARDTKDLLTSDADARVSSILKRAPTSDSPPALVDGVVSSGENLGAAVVATVSDLLLEEGREFKKEVKIEARKGVAKSIVKFSAEKGADIGKILMRNDHIWGNWISEHVQDILDSFQNML